MKRFRFLGIAVLVALALGTGITLHTHPPVRASQSSTGNDAPSGPHFNLNLHGVETGQGFTTSGSNNNIWVPLSGTCKIDLSMGSFGVTNPDCVNSDAAFSLPCPVTLVNGVCTDTTGTLSYSAYVRILGPNNGSSATLTACFTDTTGTFCNAGTLNPTLSRVTPPKFENVSKQLLQVCVGGNLIPLFTNSNINYLWEYDNNGVRLAQLRFYPNVSGGATGGACTTTSG